MGISEPDLAMVAGRLRADRLFHDVDILTGPTPERTSVLVVPQGYHAGHVLRERVLRQAGDRVRVVLVREIPRHPDGRLDRDAALAAMREPDVVVLAFEPPANEVERRLVDLVVEVLPGTSLSMTDSLVGLGADSIAVMELVGRFREEFGVDLDPQKVFQAESLRDLAGLLAGSPAPAPQ
jgi:acyl carrier protein